MGLRSTDERPFLEAHTTTVDDSGSFEATIDTSAVSGGATVAFVVTLDGSHEDEWGEAVA